MIICISCEEKQFGRRKRRLFSEFIKLEIRLRDYDARSWVGNYRPIADLVSEMNFGCLIKLLNRFCLTYSAARAPPWPESFKKKSYRYILHF